MAIGLRHVDAAQAATELRSSMRGQWTNGLLPHLTFLEGATPDGTYRTDPDFWQSGRSADAPTAPATSGIISPPIQATVVLEVATSLGDGANPFLVDMYPRLAAWHDYILATRTRDGIPLAEVWHPWETARGNAPAWDEPLRFIDVSSIEDLRSNAGADVTESWFDDRSLAIVSEMRSDGYPAGSHRRATSFAVHDVMFNSVLARAELDLATIADRIGLRGDRHEERGRRVALFVDRLLYDREASWPIGRDSRTGAPLRSAAACALAPLFAGIVTEDRAELLVQGWRSMAAPEGARTRGLMGTSHPTEPAYDATAQHRGPIQAPMNWMLEQGLRRYGFDREADVIRASLLQVIEAQGFRSRYGLLDGTGHGRFDHSATAAVALDLADTISID